MTAPLTVTHRIRQTGPLHVVERSVTGSRIGIDALWHPIHAARSHAAALRFATMAVTAFAARHPGAVAVLEPTAPQLELRSA